MFLENIETLIPLIYLSVLSSVLAFILLNYTIAQIEAYKSAMFASLITVIALVSSIIFLKESFTFLHIIGCAFILVCVSSFHKKELRILDEKIL